MELEQVEKIRYCRQTIKGILAEVEPVNEEEWEAFETLTSVHKALRKIDLGKISQQRMNLTLKEPVADQIPLPDGIEGAMATYGEDSLVERQDTIDNESDKKRLIIKTPEDGADDQQYHIFIGDSETVGSDLLATITAALAEFNDQIPDCLCEEDQALLRGILETGQANKSEKPKRQGRRPKKALVGLGFNTGDDESP